MVIMGHATPLAVLELKHRFEVNFCGNWCQPVLQTTSLIKVYIPREGLENLSRQLPVRQRLLCNQLSRQRLKHVRLHLPAIVAPAELLQIGI